MTIPATHNPSIDSHQKDDNKSLRNTARWFYCIAWILVFLFPVIYLGELDEGSRRLTMEQRFNLVVEDWLSYLPYLAVFLINQTILLPWLFSRRRFKSYFLAVLATLTIFGVYQYHTRPVRRPPQTSVAQRPPRPRPAYLAETQAHPPRHPGRRPPLHGIMGPLSTKIIIALLLMGCGIGTHLMFRYFETLRRNKELETMQLEQELLNLKSQISPHFFMNMLNNIHGIMETDVKRAQEMVLKMSALMRYVTYESTNRRLPIEKERDFIHNYIELMRERYPANRVTVTLHLPNARECEGITVPPMIFITFIENAFKHGISYTAHSMIDISLSVVGPRIIFSCVNTVQPNKPAAASPHGGMGLRNVRKRLALIYGSDSTLQISNDNTIFKVNLNIPAHENQVPCNR